MDLRLDPFKMRRTYRPTWVTWLRAQAKRHDPIGDLAKDALADRRACDFDLDIHDRSRSPRGLRRHIEGRHHAPDKVFDALDAAEREWRRVTTNTTTT
jgi:hypothetical protein